MSEIFSSGLNRTLNKMSATEIILLVVREGLGWGLREILVTKCSAFTGECSRGTRICIDQNHPSVHCTVWNAIVHTADPLDHTFLNYMGPVLCGTINRY